MNINLSAAAAKKKSASQGNRPDNSNVSYGLNHRGGRSVFEEEDSSHDEDENHGASGRDEVNRDIAAEQAALRKRAQAALNSTEAALYDYDGAYDSIHAQRQEEAQKQRDAQKKQQGSRYVTDLLHAAKKRERERDAIYERKLAKEQAEEDAKEDYQGKEKFITKAYKRKLAEREQWAEEDEAQRLAEEQDDVAKKKDGEAFANFYGNLNRNVAMGGRSADDDKKEPSHFDKEATENIESDERSKRQKGNSGSMSFLEGFEQADTAKPDTGEEQQQSDDKETAPETAESKRATARKAREEKVAQARIRYFQRHGISDSINGAKQ